MPLVNSLNHKSSFAAAILLAALLAACTSAPAPLPTPTQAAAVETAAPVPVEEFPQDVYILHNSLAWSPDDSVLAFTAGNGTAWLKKPGEPSRAIKGINTEDYANLFVSWSPDGRSLLVYGTWGSGYPYWTGLWKVDVEAGEVEQVQALVEPVLPELVVQQNDSSISSVSWAADGRSFAYTFQADAWLYELESGTTRQISRVPENPLEAEDMFEPFDGVRRLALSPAGRWLAVELSCNCPSPFSGVGVVDLDSGEARLLRKGAHLLGWSPDGQWATLRNTTGDFSWDYTYDVYGANPLTGQLTNLTRSNPKFDPLLQGWDAYAPAEYQVGRLLWGHQDAYLYTVQDFAVEGSSTPEIPGEGFIALRSLHVLLAKYMPTTRASYLYPQWLPDSRIAYIQVVPEEEAMFGAYPDWQPYILDQPLDKGGVGGMLAGAAWSPGGTYLAILLGDELGVLANRIELIPTGTDPVFQTPALQSTPTPPAPK
jgi:dipeptidyl aminopeptidase/acylaminoacyl peptidase